MSKIVLPILRYFGVTMGIMYLVIVCAKSNETRPKNSNLHFVMYNGNKNGLIRQHKLVGELLECTYVGHTDYSGTEAKLVSGTGADRSRSRVLTVEEIDSTENKLLSIKCQIEKMEKWSKDILKSMGTNMLTVMEIESWKNDINPKKLAGELGKILAILENKGSNPMKKVLNSVEAFLEYLNELYSAYYEYNEEEGKLKGLNSIEKKKTGSQVATILLGKKENTALLKLLKIVRNNANDMREMKSLMERLFPLASSEACVNKILEGLELVQISFFLLNGLNVLSVIEEQRIENRFRRDMMRRNAIIQNEIESKTLSMYPKFSEAPNFEQVLNYLFKTVEKAINEKERSRLKTEMAKNFESIVSNFGINCPYTLTNILKSGRITQNINDEKLFDTTTINNCRVAWKEISSYLYSKGQIVPFPALRLAIKKSIDKIKGSVLTWPRNAKGLYDKVMVDEKFQHHFDVSDEHTFVSTCLDTLQGEIGVKSIHGLSLDHIIVICFNFYNLLEVFVENYNYSGDPESGKGEKKANRATKRNATLKTLPYLQRAKALDSSISISVSGIIDFPPFFKNDLDRVVIGIVPDKFIETCSQRTEQVFGPSTKYGIENSISVCSEALSLLKEYDFMTQNPKNSEKSFDIFEQFRIVDVSYLPNKYNKEPDKVDFVKLYNGLNKIEINKELEHESKEHKGMSPLEKLDVVKTYHLLKELHLQWMEQMRNDPRYRGLTSLELKNNSPWIKQINLWHSLITRDVPEIRYAATYLNNRPSRFPLLPGDKRGKIKKIKPLEEIINEEGTDPRFRARYALAEDGMLDEDEDEDSIYGGATYEESDVPEEDGLREYRFTKIHEMPLSNDRSLDSKYYSNISEDRLDELKKNSFLDLGELDGKYTGDRYRIMYKAGISTKMRSKDLEPENGCVNEEIPLNWGIRATVLYNNMNAQFKSIKFRNRYGPENFVSIDDICYIFEREFKVKGNSLKSVMDVSLMICFKWFNKYLAKLWGPFGSERLKNDIKNLCWKSGFRGWL